MALAVEMDEGEAEAQTRTLLEQQQWFLAYDAARNAIARWPGNARLRQYAARALISLQAPEEAEKILEPLCPAAEGDEETLGLLARVHKAKWQESQKLEDARRWRGVYPRAFESTRGGCALRHGQHRE